MSATARTGELLLGLAFVWVGVAVLREALRKVDRARRHLAFAVGLLGVSAVMDVLAGGLSATGMTAIGGVSLAAFLLSGWELLTFRDLLLPELTGAASDGASRALKVVAATSLATAGAWTVAADVGSGWEATVGPGQLLAVTAAFAAWGLCVAEAAIRFVVVGRTRPSVQRNRLRSLAAGYVGLVGVLGAIAVAASPGTVHPLLANVLQAFCVVPGLLIYAGATTPRWARAKWSRSEERALFESLEGLVGFSHDGPALSARALESACRLVGADAGVVWDTRGNVVARVGLTLHEADRVSRELASDEPTIGSVSSPSVRQTLVVPLTAGSSHGALAVLAGPLTPSFARDETTRLRRYASIVALALERTKLEEMKGAFLSAMSHELRTPLTSILGFALTLEQQKAAIPTRKREELITRLGANARRLDNLLTDLLDVDRLARGSLEPRRRPTDVGALVRRVVADMEILQDRPVLVLADSVIADVDPAQVERILEKLLSNAAKHTPAGTRIWVRLRDQWDGILLRVEDEGPGVPRDMRGAIFEPFQQGARVPAHAPGTGVGLSLVARLAQLHGGEAGVDDRAGGGASFRVYLPHRPPPLRESVQPVAAAG